jgi:hypothetical protein
MSLLQSLFGQRATRPGAVANTRVLVCCVDQRFADAAAIDAQTYARHYRSVQSATVADEPELRLLLRQGWDIVHLFCAFRSDGMIERLDIPGRQLLLACRHAGVTLVWIASEMRPELLAAALPSKGIAINLVATLDRNGAGFTAFLDGLLGQMAHGATMPKAWVKLWPQNPNLRDPSAPGLVFAAGRGEAVLQP